MLKALTHFLIKVDFGAKRRVEPDSDCADELRPCHVYRLPILPREQNAE
jgi:hypothetical protein